MGTGKLYGVSVGPGDPELMTIKAARIIREADVIALPHEEKESCMAYRIAVKAVPQIRQKEYLLIPMPMTKDPGKLEKSHRDGAERIMGCIREGKQVAFLSIGDVTVYSTCWYLYRRVRKMGAEGELISGVPSFCAAAARLDRALVSGREELHILPASYQIEKGLHLPGVKVLMKAGKQIGKVKERIKELGLLACGVQRCGMEGEVCYHHTEEIEEEAGYYSLFIVEEKKQTADG